jgi:HEAT repeat protein
MADLTALMSQLEMDDPGERAEAAEELCRLGEAARPAATALVVACGDASEGVRQWAAAALEGLGPPENAEIESLIGLVQHEHNDVAYWALTLLGRAGEGARSSVETLADALANHPAAAVRQRAAWALGKIGPAASSARGVLDTAAASDDPRLVRLAARAIEKIQR